MPSEVKELYEENIEKQQEIVKEVQDSVNGASRPAALGLYASGALAAVIAGAAVVL